MIIPRPSPDTVRFFLPCDEILLGSLPFAYRTLKAFYNPGDHDTDQTRFTFYPFTFDELDRLPSSHSMPALSPQMASADHPSGLYIQVSVPKMLRGHSLWNPGLSDLEAVIQGIYEALSRIWPDTPSVQLWRITRLDLSINLHCQDLAQVQDYRRQLSVLRYLGKPSHSTSKKRSFLCYWAGRSRTVKFYSKGLEILGTDSERSRKVFDSIKKQDLAAAALPVLRFEVEYHREGLLSALGVKHSKDLTLLEVLDWYESLDFKTWWDSYLAQFDRPGPVMTLTELEEKISQLPKAEVYREFARAIIDYGIDWVQANTPKTTFFNRLRQLRKFDIEPAHLAAHWARTTGFRLPQLGPLSQLPLHPGDDRQLPVDDFSQLVQSYASGAITNLSKVLNGVTPCLDQKNA